VSAGGMGGGIRFLLIATGRGRNACADKIEDLVISSELPAGWKVVMRGRKPMPTVLKRLHGVEPRRINDNEPPIPKAGLLPCPEHFTPEQAELWDHAIAIAPPGMMTGLDLGLLEAWCVAHSIHRAAVTELAREGALTVPGIKDPDRRVPTPVIGIITRTAALMSRLASDLGFSPTARSRVQVESVERFDAADDDAPRESLDEYLRRGKRLHAKVQTELTKRH
jgi:P27 family predicted phage terminase small subunit